jgi:iron complex outermembrane receptor protein
MILSYDLMDEVMIYGGWSKGFSSGGMNSTVRFDPYEPEVSKNWEIGFKSQLFSGRLRLNMTAFYNDYENQQTSQQRQINQAVTIIILNAQEATLYGAETELTWLPADNWLVNLAYGYVDGEYDEFIITDLIPGPPPDLVPIPTERDLTHLELVRGSPYTLNLSIQKDFHLGAGNAVSVQVGYARRGRRWDDLDQPDFSRQDSYGLVDSRVTWRFSNQQTSLSLWGTNLTDEKYTVAQDGGLTSNLQRRFWGPPRMYGIELNHRFGS